MLQSESADLEEAAILALGCISDQDGSYGGIEPHLESLVPYLIEKLEHSSKDVRSTTCWTLSKFSEWIGCVADESQELPEQRQYIFSVYHQKLVERVVDAEEKVQESALHAYSNLVEIVPERC